MKTFAPTPSTFISSENVSRKRPAPDTGKLTSSSAMNHPSPFRQGADQETHMESTLRPLRERSMTIGTPADVRPA